jgi:alpha-tubulin suppressor-like RCC1 family protein
MNRRLAVTTVALLGACGSESRLVPRQEDAATGGSSRTGDAGGLQTGGSGGAAQGGGAGGSVPKGGSGGSSGNATGGATTTGGVSGAGEKSGDGGASAGEGGSGDAGDTGDAGEPGGPNLAITVSLPCALSAGVVKCWGGNSSGSLGVGDQEDRGDQPGEMGSALPAVNLGSGHVALSLASRHGGCAILDGNLLKCWGLGSYGQLGLGDQNSRGDGPGEMGNDLPAVDLGTGVYPLAVARRDHACALLTAGKVKCWGTNRYGQLGQGDTDDRGDEPGEMGDDLPSVDLGTYRHATALTIGGDHSCALLDDSSLKCWGSNVAGGIGAGVLGNLGDEPDEMGDALPTVDLGTGRHAVSVAGGDYHTCAILDDGTLKCWGNNEFGQLGLGDTEARGDDANEMGENLPAVDLGPGRRAIAVVGGSLHTCAILDDETVKCWGWNQFGQLGLGDTNPHGDEPGEMGADLPVVELGTGVRVRQLSLLDDVGCAVLAGGAVKCWGYNGVGALGRGDTNWPVPMGDALPTLDLGF